jgi:hypothetical protein
VNAKTIKSQANSGWHDTFFVVGLSGTASPAGICHPGDHYRNFQGMLMPFGLQSDITDRALPNALHTLLVQQTTVLEAFLDHAKGTMDAIRANGHLSLQEQMKRIDALAQEVTKRLSVLEDQNAQMQAQLEAFQRLLRQQGNSILAYTVKRMKEVLAANFRVARQQLDAIIHRQSTS